MEAAAPAKPFVYAFSGTDDDGGVSELSDVGGKAQALIQSTKAGFPVPQGFVLSVEFFQPWMNIVQQESKEWTSFAEWLDEQASSEKDFSDDVTYLNQQCAAIKTFCKTNLSLTKAQTHCLDEAIQSTFTSSKNSEPQGGEQQIEGDEASKIRLYAVRSSSPEEDLEGTSFAGGYETTLAVPEKGIQQAIILSFLSVFDERVVQYKQQHQTLKQSILHPRIAVIVQEQIASDVSGVAFSINPQTNCYDEVLINANFGLGESIVAGQVTPDSFLVDKITQTITDQTIAQKDKSIWIEAANEDESVSRVIEKDNMDQADKPCLTEAHALEVASLTAKVEEHYGKPMDIEWAIHNNSLYLLQARPITAYLPLFPEMLTVPGEQKLLYLDIVALSQGFSDPMSTLGCDVWNKMVVCAKPTMASDENDPQNVLFCCHGKMYGNVSTIAKTIGIRGVSKMMFAEGKSLGERMSPSVLSEYTPKGYTSTIMKKSTSRMLYGTLSQLPSLVSSYFWFESSMQDYKDTSEIVLSHFSDIRHNLDNYTFEEITQRCEVDMALVCTKIGFIAACMYAQWRLSKLFKPEDNAEEYLQKLQMDLPGNPTSRMGHLMCDLAAFGEIQQTDSGEEFAKKLECGDVSVEFKQAYENYMTEFGCRCIREIEIATPRSYESPANFFQQLKLIDVNNNAITTVKERRLTAFNTLLWMAKKNGKEKAFRKYEEMQRKGWGYREHPKYFIVTVVDLLRRKALSLAAQWEESGRIDLLNDVFNLTLNEMVAAEEDSTLNLRTAIERNLAPRRAVAKQRQWPLVIDSRGRFLQEKRPELLGDGEYACEPISPGVARGRANVLHSPYEKPLRKGEILVTHATDPGWTPIFINAAAVVLEVGGQLQHGAIIAREYGLPCVSGMTGATEVIRDGQLIEVDGTRGIIRILDDCDEAPTVTDKTDK
jgi:phosphohistidine swiveling domain-containing protein